MGVSCHVEIDGVTFKPRRPYIFDTVPRKGELISLEHDGKGFPRYHVDEVLHVPDEVQDLPAFTVLYVSKMEHF